MNLGNSHELQQLGVQIVGSSQTKVEFTLSLGYSVINNDPSYSDGGYVTLTGLSTKLNTSGDVEAKEFDRKMHQIATPVSGKITVGIYFNQISKQLGYVINGANYGNLNISTENSIKNTGYYLSLQQTPNANSKFLGKQVSKYTSYN